MLSRYSVKKPYTVAVGIILVVVLGFISFSNMTTDLLPSMDLPYMVIYTTYVGASPEEVEMTVTKPMEAAMATVSDIKEITSVSQENASQVILEFNSGADMNTAMIEVNAKIDMIAPNWSDSVGTPVLMKLNPDMLPVMVASVDKEGADVMALSRYVEDRVKPALEAVNGVASVSTAGLIEQSVEVSIEQSKIDELNKVILREVDEELADIEDKLDEGESQLLKAKRELDKQGKAGLKKIEKGLDQIGEGRGQLAQGIEQLNAQRAQLAAQLAQAQAGEQQLNQTLAQLPDALTGEQAAALQAMKEQVAQLQAQVDERNKELAQVQAELDKLQQPTAAPTQTPNPDETADPNATPNPEETVDPNATPNPDETADPNATPNPDETADPNATPNPDVTVDPNATPNADETVDPNATPNADETVDPNATPNADETGETAEPNETADAEARPSASPEGGGAQTPAPVQSAEPTPEAAADALPGLLGGLAVAPEPSQAPEGGEGELPREERPGETARPTSTPEAAKDDPSTPEASQAAPEGDAAPQQESAPEAPLEEARPFSLVASASAQSLSEEELLARKAQLEAEIAALKQGIEQVTLSEAYQQLNQLDDAIKNRPQLEAQLAELRAAIPQLQGGIAQVDATLAKLNQGIVPGGMIEGMDEDTNLDEMEEQLKDARKQAKKAISEGKKKIADAQRELGEKRKEFEDAREDAFKEAKLDGVITLDMVGGLLVAQNFEMPAGYLDEEGQEVLVRVGNKFDAFEDMRDMLLFELELDSLPEVRLSDVATVEYTDNSDDTYCRVNGNNGVVLSFQKQSTYSTAEVSHALQAKFDALAQEDAGLRITPLLDQGVYIDVIISSVLENLVYGGLLAILILLVFLGSFKPTLVIALSIPTSVVTAFVVMYFTGITLNVMSLAGLALGVGMLVDNSIVVIENIYRLRGEGMPILQACVQGAKQMSGAIFSSTLTTICVFLPVVFVQGLARDLFTDMGLTIAYSLLASLVVALTVVPVMSSGLLKKTKPKKQRVFKAIQRAYAALLRGSLRAKPVVLLLAVALLAFSAAQVAGMGASFMPDVDSTQMSCALTVPKEYTFEQTTHLADQVLSAIMEVEDVETVGVFEQGSGVMTVGSGGGDVSFYLSLKEDKALNNHEIASLIQQKVAPLHCDLTIQTSNMDISMLAGSGISVEVKGPDIDTLRQISSDVAGMMRAIEGTADVSDGQEETTPEIDLVVDKQAAIEEGLTVAQIYQEVARTLAGGQEVTTLTLADRDYPVIAVDGDNQRLTREDLTEITIEVTRADETVQVRLGDVCEVVLGQSLQSIHREAQERKLSATCSIADGYNIGLVSRELEQKLKDYQVPDGYSVSISGESETITSTIGDLITMIALAIVLIYLIMVAQFQSFLSPFIVLFTIPLAFTGGLLALIFAGMDISMVSLLGFLVLAGIVVNNGIVFVDSVNQMRLAGMEKREALVETGRVRLRPILMTALTTILGMSTMALGAGMGAEMMQPMAVVTIGGLSYATFMTLFVVPVLYDMFTGKKMKVRDVDGLEPEKAE